MNCRITFKTPDVVDRILDEVKADLDYDISKGILDEDVAGDILVAFNEKLKTWISYGELVTIEFDLDNMTATVVKQKR